MAGGRVVATRLKNPAFDPAKDSAGFNSEELGGRWWGESGFHAGRVSSKTNNVKYIYGNVENKWTNKRSPGHDADALRGSVIAVMGNITELEKRFRAWMRRARNGLELSQTDLARLAGVGRGVISSLENRGLGSVTEVTWEMVIRTLAAVAAKKGIELKPTVEEWGLWYALQVDDDRKQRLEEHFSLPPTGLTAAEGSEADTEDMGKLVGRMIPVIGTVPGGPTALRFQWSEASPEVGFETIDRGDLPDGATYFALRVDGDSMTPAIQNSDTIVCSPLPRYENVDPKRLDGKVVVVQFTEDSDYKGETTLARWRVMGERILLTKDNPRYTPMDYPDGGVHGVAVVVELRRRAAAL